MEMQSLQTFLGSTVTELAIKVLAAIAPPSFGAAGTPCRPRGPGHQRRRST
jgi:hypothetical protein